MKSRGSSNKGSKVLCTIPQQTRLRSTGAPLKVGRKKSVEPHDHGGSKLLK